MDTLERMPDEFFDWLDECPVQLFLNKRNQDDLEYRFICPEENEDDN